MKTKEAIAMAVSEVKDLFGDQSITNVQFEEMDRNGQDEYLVTVGFNRQLESNAPYSILGAGINPRTERVYKVVRIHEAFGVQAVKDRFIDRV